MPTELVGFDAFLDREFAVIAMLAGTICGDFVAGEDIAQQAMTRTAERWQDLQSYDKPGAWTRRIAINLAINKKRRGATEKRALRLISNRRCRRRATWCERCGRRFDGWRRTSQSGGSNADATAIGDACPIGYTDADPEVKFDDPVWNRLGMIVIHDDPNDEIIALCIVRSIDWNS